MKYAALILSGAVLLSGAGLCVRMRDGSYLGRRPDGPKSFIE